MKSKLRIQQPAAKLKRKLLAQQPAAKLKAAKHKRTVYWTMGGREIKKDIY